VPRRPADGKGAQTRQAILDAAIARFGREGYRSTTVAHIARDAGVGGTVAFAYFPNKEALFLAAVDEDAASVINEALSAAMEQPFVKDWPLAAMSTLLAALEHHPLARRLLAGLEPEVTPRVLEIPARSELRKELASQLAKGQIEGTVRADIDPFLIAEGIVSLMLSLLMSVVQLGSAATEAYFGGVAAVLVAAIEPSR
jgi:AcrR family transcriptional regulator